MEKTKTRQVARLLSNATGRGHMIYNDRLADGTRSLKVWGWTGKDYATAQELLQGMGCRVDMVQAERYDTRGGLWRTVTRLHVQE